MNHTKQQIKLQKIKSIFLLIWKKSIVKTLPFSLINFIVTYNIVFPELSLRPNGIQNLLNSITWLVISKVCVREVISAMCNVSTIYIINKIISNETIYFLVAINHGFKKCLSYLGILVLYFLILISFPILFFISNKVYLHNEILLYIFVFLVFIPSVVMYIYCMLATYLLVIDQNSIKSSFVNSFYLVVGNWWYVFLLFLVECIVGLIFQNYTFMVDKFLKDSSNSLILLGILSCTIFITPLIHSLFVILVHVFKEGKQLKSSSLINFDNK